MRLKLKEQKWNNTISAKHHKHMGNKSHYAIVIFLIELQIWLIKVMLLM